ncbi:MAG TPA: DUF2934 domain-containing protein [Devosia sp.]|jgi:hypothetical protein
MYEDTEKFVDLDFEQRVRQAAYHLWEDDGRPFGKETEYWFRALEQLLAERGQDKPKLDLKS